MTVAGHSRPDGRPHSTPPFEITVDLSHRSASIRLAGELDLAAADHLQVVVATVVRLPGIVSIDVDTGRLGFVDWVGLRALLRARDDAAGVGVTWILASASPALLRILDLADVGIELAHPCMN